MKIKARSGTSMQRIFSCRPSLSHQLSGKYSTILTLIGNNLVSFRVPQSVFLSRNVNFSKFLSFRDTTVNAFAYFQNMNGRCSSLENKTKPEYHSFYSFYYHSYLLTDKAHSTYTYVNRCLE